MRNQKCCLSYWFVFVNMLAALLAPNSASAVSTPQIAAGTFHSLALDSAGNVYFWGAYGGNSPSYKMPTIVPSLGNIIAISAADTSSLALRADGAVFQLNSTFPNGKLVAGLPTATAISQGPHQSFAITNSGDVWSWGSNTNCGLGLGITQDSNLKAPAIMPGLSNIVSIAAGDLLYSAADSSGNIYVWGCLPNSGGGYIYNYPTPTLVKSLKFPKNNGLANIALDDAFAVGTDGTLWAWNGTLFAYLAIKQNPELLTNASSLDRLQPIAVPNVNHVARISSNPEDFFLYLIYEDGTAGRITMLVPDPTDISKWEIEVAPLPAPNPSTSYIQIAAGQSHIIALQSDGTVVSWGANEAGQLGDGTTTRRNNPVSVQGLNLGASTIATIPQNYSDSWWNANESGWGITIVDHDTNAFVQWYTYDHIGHNQKYVISGGTFSNGKCQFNGEIQRVTGPSWTLPTFDPNQVSRTTVGSGTIDFCPTGLTAGTIVFNYTADGVTGSKQLTRLPFGNDVPHWGGTANTGASDFTDLWWNPAESGWGVSVTQHGDNVFFRIFVYDTDNKPLLFVVPGVALTSATSFAGNLVLTTGPWFGNATFDPNQVVRTTAGTATLTFSDANNGVLTYTVNGVTVTKSITRMVF